MHGPLAQHYPLLIAFLAALDEWVYTLPGHTLRPLQDFWACSRQTTLPRWYADILPRRGEPYEHRGVYHRLVL